MSGHFHESTIAALRPTTGRNIAIESRGVIRPDSHVTTITKRQGIGVNFRSWADISGLSILNQRISTVEIATD